MASERRKADLVLFCGSVMMMNSHIHGHTCGIYLAANYKHPASDGNLLHLSNITVFISSVG